MKFIIDRSKWRSGGDHENQIGTGITSLLNEDGFMCCLGFCANQMGFSSTLNVPEPLELYGRENNKDADDNGILVTKHKYVDGSYYYDNTELSKQAIDINDDESLSQREREKRLRELFKKHGHQIVFKGRSVKLSFLPTYE